MIDQLVCFPWRAALGWALLGLCGLLAFVVALVGAYRSLR